MLKFQWWVQNFPKGKNTENYIKLKEFGPGVASLAPTLDLPLNLPLKNVHHFMLNLIDSEL